MTPAADPPRDHTGFNIAVVCALSLEAECVLDIFDEIWDPRKYGRAQGDNNAYTFGAIGEHNVVLVHLPGTGTMRAANAAGYWKLSFPNIKLALVVGTCGGMPYGTSNEEIALGDVVISKALVQYDFGKQYEHGFQRKTNVLDTLGPLNEKILALQARLAARQNVQVMQENTAAFLRAIQQRSLGTRYPGTENDILYHSSYTHRHRPPFTCDACEECDGICESAIQMSCEALGCDSRMRVIRKRLASSVSTEPQIHFGIMGSGDTVMKSAKHRDMLAQNDDIVAIEMEGTGVWRHGPSVVIKGVCDYADSHKTKAWQRYAAATAAACAKAFLLEWMPEEKQINSGQFPLI